MTPKWCTFLGLIRSISPSYYSTNTYWFVSDTFATVTSNGLISCVFHLFIKLSPATYGYITSIKNNQCWNICNEIDDISHFLLLCPNVRNMWQSGAEWWSSITKTNITNVDHHQENILFGFVINNTTHILNLYFVCNVNRKVI